MNVRCVMAGLVLTCSSAFAASYQLLPEDGLWWNPTEPGRGWAIEVQDNVIVVTHYVYDSAGRATFYTSAGPWDGLGVTGPLVLSQGGQCLGCGHVAPISTSPGNVRLTFTSGTSGTVTYPNGVAVPIRRLTFGYLEGTQALMGGWTSSYGISGAYLGEPLVLNEVYSDPSIPYAVRGTVAGRANMPALFTPVTPGGNEIIGIVASAVTHNTYYRFTRDRLNAWFGFACPYSVGSLVPVNCAIPMIAHRWIGPTAYAQLGLEAPVADKAAPALEGYRQQMLAALEHVDDPVGDEVKTADSAAQMALALRLESALRELATEAAQ